MSFLKNIKDSVTNSVVDTVDDAKKYLKNTEAKEIAKDTVVLTGQSGFKYPHNNNLRFELKVSKLDSDMLADGGEDPVDGIEQVIGGLVVQRPKPAFFHFLPKAFNDVVVRRIRRQVVDEQVALLP